MLCIRSVKECVLYPNAGKMVSNGKKMLVKLPITILFYESNTPNTLLHSV
jgi:hypothetical protein